MSVYVLTHQFKDKFVLFLKMFSYPDLSVCQSASFVDTTMTGAVQYSMGGGSINFWLRSMGSLFTF